MKDKEDKRRNSVSYTDMYKKDQYRENVKKIQ